MRVMFQGDPQASEPSAYFFDLEIENEVAFKTVLDGDLAPQAQAIRTLGFNYNGGCSGIYKMWK